MSNTHHKSLPISHNFPKNPPPRDSSVLQLGFTIGITIVLSQLSYFTHLNWLVVSPPLKNISQLGWLFPIYGKIKHVPVTTNQSSTQCHHDESHSDVVGQHQAEAHKLREGMQGREQHQNAAKPGTGRWNLILATKFSQAMAMDRHRDSILDVNLRFWID